VIADNCATFANQMFSDPASYNGSTLFLGALFFTFQIYGDFSGYSDIAIGTARLFGFKLMRNFAYPYFSRDVAEFWRRWHISLSSWFRDYLYIPLGGSRAGTWKKVRNTFIIFLVSGFWHGANWTFIMWGALNAIYFLPLMLSNRNRNNMETVAEGSFFPNLKELLGIGGTFLLTTLTWIFFRAASVWHAFEYLGGIFQPDFFQLPEFNGKLRALITFGFIFFMLFMEWIARADQHALEKIPSSLHPALRISFYYLIVFFMLWYSGTQQEFIYFQF
jgi:D-alanyl-lipoteichoic acid acyltransferase DltB (MBOAT superfamily)